MNSIDIIWAGWQHAQDLERRKIFEWLEVFKTEKWDSLDKNTDWKIIIAPIAKTEQIITRLSDYSWTILNLSWIMSTNPDWLDKIDNVHFLFWPKGKENLKAIFAWDYNQITAKIIQNTKKQWIKIIESSSKEHDTNMAYTQALTHFMIFLRSLWDENKSDFKNSKTPFHLIKDMINYNPYFANIFNQFFSWVKIWDNISKKYIEFINDKMWEKNQKIFWTPNFIRTMERNQKNDPIIIDSILINFIKVFQKTINSRNKSDIKLDLLEKYLKT